jgi:hypothetical protein
MPSYYNQLVNNQTLGSDQNGNQLTWQNQTNPPQQPNSLGGYQQPGGGGWNPNFPQINFSGWGQTTNYNPNPNYLNASIMPIDPWARKPSTTPGQGFVNAPQNLGGFAGFTQPKKPDMNIATRWTNPTSNAPIKPPVPATNAYKKPETQRNGMPYPATQVKLPPGSSVNVGYNKYVDAQKDKYNLGPGQKYQQFIKNGAIYAKNSADMKTLWQNYHALDNWPKAPVAQPATVGYGYGGYSGWSYGGGGGGSRKYAENLPGAVWRMNQ